MKYEIGDIIYANKYYNWHDSKGNGTFHDVFQNDAFEILNFDSSGHVMLKFIREDCEIIMLTSELDSRFNIRVLRKQKLNQIFNKRRNALYNKK